MPSIETGKPAKLGRLAHVDTLLYYNDELVGHYTVDGDPWIRLYTNFKNKGTHYWDRAVYFPITESNLKKLLANELTIYAALEAATEMWREENTWEKLPNGHGVPDTYVTVWEQTSWSQFPDDEKPSKDSFLAP